MILKNIKKNFTLMSILLIPIAIAINMIGGAIAVSLKLPIYLDSIGTIITAVLAGPWVGAVAGVLTSVVSSLTIDPMGLPFGLVQIAVALVTGFLANRGYFDKLLKTVLAGVIIAIVSAVVASPIAAYLFGGVTSAGSTFIVGWLLASGQELFASVFTSQILSDGADKILSAILAFMIIRNMSERYKVKFRGDEIA